MKNVLLVGLLTLTPALAGGAGAPPPAQATLRMTAPDGTAFTMRGRSTTTVRVLGDTNSPLAQGFAGVSPITSDLRTAYRVQRTAGGAELVSRRALPLPDGREAELRQVEVFGPTGELRGLRIESEAPELVPLLAALTESGPPMGNTPYGMPLRAGATRIAGDEFNVSTLFNNLTGGLLPAPALGREAQSGTIARSETTVTALGPQPGGFGFRVVTRTEALSLDVSLPGGGDLSMRSEPSEAVATVVYDAQGLPLRGESRIRQQLTLTTRLPGEAPTTVRLEQEAVATFVRE